MTHIPLRRTPQDELLAALLGYEQYAKKMSRNRPADTDDQGVIAQFGLVKAVGKDRLTEDWIAARAVSQKVVRMSKAVAAKARKHQETLMSPCKTPDMRVERTPGKAAKGLRLSYLDLDGNKHVTDLFDQEVDEETNSFVKEFLCLPNHRGWLLHYCFIHENIWSGRWRYWEETQTYGKLLNAPIPQIEWESEPHRRTIQHLNHCLDTISPTWRDTVEEKRRTIDYFFDWLLWGLGHALQPAFPLDHWGGRTHDKLLQVFCPSWLVMAPHDYFGWLLEQHAADLDIPPQISMAEALAVVETIFPDGWTQRSNGKGGFAKGRAKRDYRRQILVDPETGSGRVLLAGSNYSLVGIGYNTNARLSKAALINAYLFIPWAVYPFPFLFERNRLDLLSLLGRTLEISTAKSLSQQYFGLTEPDPEAARFVPIQQRRWRITSPNLKPQGIKGPNVSRKQVSPQISFSQPRPALAPNITIASSQQALPPGEETIDNGLDSAP